MTVGITELPPEGMQLGGVALAGDAERGTKTTEGLSLLFTAAGITVQGPQPQIERLLVWSGLDSATCREKVTLPDGRSAAVMELTSGGQSIRFLFPTESVTPGQAAYLDQALPHWLARYKGAPAATPPNSPRSVGTRPRATATWPMDRSARPLRHPLRLPKRRPPELSPPEPLPAWPPSGAVLRPGPHPPLPHERRPPTPAPPTVVLPPPRRAGPTPDRWLPRLRLRPGALPGTPHRLRSLHLQRPVRWQWVPPHGSRSVTRVAAPRTRLRRRPVPTSRPRPRSKRRGGDGRARIPTRSERPRLPVLGLPPRHPVPLLRRRLPLRRRATRSPFKARRCPRRWLMRALQCGSRRSTRSPARRCGPASPIPMPLPRPRIKGRAEVWVADVPPRPQQEARWSVPPSVPRRWPHR